MCKLFTVHALYAIHLVASRNTTFAGAVASIRILLKLKKLARAARERVAYRKKTEGLGPKSNNAARFTKTDFTSIRKAADAHAYAGHGMYQLDNPWATKLPSWKASRWCSI